jgi:GT2 family glycosyltransferase
VRSPAAADASDVEVLIPTRDRPAALAVTLAGLAGQLAAGFRVVVSDQSGGPPGYQDPAAASAVRLCRYRGHPVRTGTHHPRRGLAEHRAHLLATSAARYVLFCDDDVWLEPATVGRLRTAIGELGCGFVGAAVQGLSYLDDVRPAEQEPYQEWRGGVRPEEVRRDGPAWRRWTLHNAANLLHIERRLGLRPGEWRPYKIAWLGACVLYDRAKLLDCGGFDFWRRLPAKHVGEDVVAQLAVMRRYGGCGIVPSGAFHLELPTTVPDRRVEAYDAVPQDRPAARR